jgi:hypothetical protein
LQKTKCVHQARKLSYYVVLTPKGMKFSGYGKRLAKQLGVNA